MATTQGYWSGLVLSPPIISCWTEFSKPQTVLSETLFVSSSTLCGATVVVVVVVVVEVVVVVVDCGMLLKLKTSTVVINIE